MNGLFGVSQARLPAQYLRYAQKIILGGKRACETTISTICCGNFFSYRVRAKTSLQNWRSDLGYVRNWAKREVLQRYQTRTICIF